MTADLFIIGKHDDARHLEDVLQPLGELERNGVANVHATAARAAARVEEEGFTALVGI
jgi:hypothetical protein